MRGRQSVSFHFFFLAYAATTLFFFSTFFICIPSDIRGLSNISQLEQLNKRYWYVCQDYTEYKYPHQPKRFPEIMMCLPEIRCIAGKRDSYGVINTAASRWCYVPLRLAFEVTMLQNDCIRN